MRKTLIALAVLGSVAGGAHAQSSLVIYGIVDTGYVKESGRDLRMGSNLDNLIGFRGSEDLGGGLAAVFELERRFNLNDGTLNNTGAAPRYAAERSDGPDWDGAANVGLSGDFGQIRFGRLNELTTETIREFDPFRQYGVGSMIWSTQRSEGIDNSVRYDSPNWSGFSFGLTYSLGQNNKGAAEWAMQGQDNDGYGINLSFDNGPLALTGNFSRLADSNSSRVWNLGGAYRSGNARVSLLYENTRDRGWRLGESSNIVGWVEGDPENAARSRQQTWLFGLEWVVGPGEIDASVQYFRLKDAAYMADPGSRSSWKYALGYTYSLSRRTAAYLQAAWTDYGNDDVGRFYHGLDRSSIAAFQIGMHHKF